MRKRLRATVAEAVEVLYGQKMKAEIIQIQRTRKEFSGDLTVVVFPVVKYSKKKPEDTANDIGVYLKQRFENLTSYNVIKGFLNLSFSKEFWIERLNDIAHRPDDKLIPERKKKVLIEFSSPNTNKPLHLGHVRNNLIGDSVARILEACGHDVVRVNLVNDRGIHICKSMQAYLDFDPEGSPEKNGMKGDKYVGDLYVKFEKTYQAEVKELQEKGLSEKEAKDKAPIMQKARQMLQKWEEGDEQVMELWNTMNQWVYEGFDKTYEKMDIRFDEIYYESDTYKIGKQIVLDGLKNGVLHKKDDNSVWADLTEEGLDEKLLLRKDGTSVYMTQDIGTAVKRFETYAPDEMVYVVGNEQNYHFQVLKTLLKKLGFAWADIIRHMSYGMVELPEGKMKSREGKVVDADDLIEAMIQTSKEMSDELGKLDDMSEKQQKEVYSMIAMGALKYFILKVDPKKNMVFNPKESIDFNGNTGPFVQYTHARIRSIVRKASKMNISVPKSISEDSIINEQELDLIKFIDHYDMVLREAGNEMDPGLVANYAFELAKEFNKYYHDYSILKASNGNVLQFRLILADEVSATLKQAMHKLGIQVPEKM
ncbi:MAG: arginine--tRNA ligase [Bacteroidota bacterium]